jgi:hypothetical protein
MCLSLSCDIFWEFRTLDYYLKFIKQCNMPILVNSFSVNYAGMCKHISLGRGGETWWSNPMQSLGKNIIILFFGLFQH